MKRPRFFEELDRSLGIEKAAEEPFGYDGDMVPKDFMGQPQEPIPVMAPFSPSAQCYTNVAPLYEYYPDGKR